MSKRKQGDGGSDVVEEKAKSGEQDESKGSTFVVTVVNDSIQGMQEWTEEETALLKQAVDADGGQFNWDVIASSVPSKDINQVKTYVLSMVSQSQESQNNQSASVIKAPIEIWTDLAQKLTSDEDKAAAVCIPQEEIYAVQTELREVVTEQRNKLNKLFTSIRSIKKAVKRTRRQTRRKLAEQNAKLDTLISLLGSNTVPTNSASSKLVASNDHFSKNKGKNLSSSTPQNSQSPVGSGKSQHLPTPARNVIPLINVNGPGDVELSPYSMVIIGQNPKVMLTRQQYSDAYFRGKNIRRFSVRLAEKVFSLDVLTRSTVMGQQPGLEKLDTEKLGAVRVEVLSRFMPNATLDEQEAKWKECLLSIGKKCQVLRSGKALKEELLNPMCSLSSDSENMSFSSPNEQTTASDSISTPNVTLKVNDVTLEDGQTPTQIDLVPLGGCSKVLIQKEDLSEAVKRGKKATFLALRLAEKVFGYEVMVGSTVTGREGTEKLDADKLIAIKDEITQRFAADQPLELQEAIWKKCLYSISTKCKVLRSQKQNPDGMDGGSLHIDGNCMSSAGDLDLLANVTCPEEQENVHRLNEAEHIVGTHSNHLGEQMTSCDTEQQQGISVVPVHQEGQMVANENHLADQTVGMDHQVVHLQQQEVPMDVQGNVQTIELHQSNDDLCGQHVQVGELVQQEYV